MNSLNKFVSSIKVLVVTFLLFVSLFSATATAATCMTEGPVKIVDGNLQVSIADEIPADFTVRSAIVSLPAGETGVIDQIIIEGPGGQREFGCGPVKIEDQTDLISACGGPAVLKAGPTTYYAVGSKFQPQTTFDSFAIKLCDDFS